MSELTPVQLEREITVTIARLRELSDDYRRQTIEDGEAEAAYRQAFARYLLASTEKTVAEREAHAMTRCGDEGTMLNRKVAAAIAEGTKSALFTERAILSGLQTQARAMADEVKQGGWS